MSQRTRAEHHGPAHPDPWVSAWALLLRKHGLLGLVDASGADVVRHPSKGAGAPFLDGPLDPRDMHTQGIQTQDAETEQVDVRLVDGPWNRLCHPRFTVRPIPRRGEVPTQLDPVVLEPSDPVWPSGPIRVQLLDLPERFTTLATTTVAGQFGPVIATDGRTVVSGLPLRALLAEAHAIAPTATSYLNHIAVPKTYELEQLVVNAIESAVLAAGGSSLRTDVWPSGHRAALTIRHDYDRVCPEPVLRGLLDTYANAGLASTWCFRLDNLEPAHAQMIAASGHEVSLHTTAGDEDAFLTEVQELERRTGVRPLGVTAHGGAGSAGYLGQHQLLWAVRAGMRYAELLGRTPLLPFQALSAADGAVTPLPLVLPNVHSSIDLTTKPDGHRLGDLQKQVPADLALGGHAVVMNHPDIHRDELRTLLAGLPLDHVWLATLADVAEWSWASRLGGTSSHDNGRWTHRFGSPLPHPAVLRVAGAGAGEVRVPAGETETVI